MQTVMQATRRHPSTATFQVAAAVDDYLACLADLAHVAPESVDGKLQELNAAVSVIRVQSAGRFEVHATCVDLLIGHAELVYSLSLTRGRTGWRRQHELLQVQTRRAEALLRIALEPLAPAR